MITVVAIVVGVLILTVAVPVHGVGIWLVISILHGAVVSLIGSDATHLPLYAGIALALGLFARRSWSGVSNRFLLMVGLMFLVMTASTIQGINVQNSIFTIGLYAKAFALTILVAGVVQDRRQFSTLAHYLFLGLLIGAFLAVFQKLTDSYAISSIYIERAAGLREDPNDTAMLLVTGVPIGLSMFTRTRHLALKAGLLVGTSLIVYAVVLTGSRGGFVALCAALAGIYAFRPNFQSSLISATLIAVLLVLAPGSYWERIQTIFTGEEQHGGSSIRNRLVLQIRGLEIFSRNIPLGVGPGNFGQAFAGMQDAGDSLGSASRGDREFAVAHNLHLEFLVENGILFGFLWAAIVVSVIKLLRSASSSSSRQALGPDEIPIEYSILVSLISMLVAGVFLSQGKNIILWFLIGLSISTERFPRAPHVKRQILKTKPIELASEFPNLLR